MTPSGTPDYRSGYPLHRPGWCTVGKGRALAGNHDAAALGRAQMIAGLGITTISVGIWRFE
jgi:hypothetical protein